LPEKTQPESLFRQPETKTPSPAVTALQNEK
jgi:hypothetical protein